MNRHIRIWKNKLFDFLAIVFIIGILLFFGIGTIVLFFIAIIKNNNSYFLMILFGLIITILSIILAFIWLSKHKCNGCGRVFTKDMELEFKRNDKTDCVYCGLSMYDD